MQALGTSQQVVVNLGPTGRLVTGYNPFLLGPGVYYLLLAADVTAGLLPNDPSTDWSQDLTILT